MTEASAEQRVPVLVVGGSLTGLSTSLFLGRRGVDHLLVEKHSGTSHHPRGRGNNVRTMELFRVAGVEQDIRRAASVLAGNHGILQAPSLTGDEQEWLFKQMDPGGGLARFSPSGWCLCSQNDLEPVLLEHARRLGGDLRFGSELLSFEQDADGVTALVKVRESGTHCTVRAEYLVAADGPRSPVREALGIGHDGPGELFHNVSITFRSRRLAPIVGDRRFIACYLTNPEADGALLPVDNEEQWVFHAPWHPDRGETLDDFTDERCARHIRTAVGDPDLDVEITGKAPWHAAERVARRFRDGRVFLVGDSAHEMSPTGAFGSNTGIQDAHNLAWKLAAVHHGWAGPALLDTYDTERRPVAAATAARASARSAEHKHPGYVPTPGPGAAGPGGQGPGGSGSPGGPGGPGGQKSGGGGPGGPGGPGGAKPGGVLTVALAYRYPSGAVVGADTDMPVVPDGMRLGGEPGTRAPHLWVDRAGHRVSTLDLYDRSLVLLTGPDGDDWRTAAERLASRLGLPLDAFRVGPGPQCELIPEGTTDWAEAHGVGPGGAVLVRPDGFVCWRAMGPIADPEAELHSVLGELLDRPN